MVEVGQRDLDEIGDWETVRLTRDQMDDALEVMVDAWLSDHAPHVDAAGVETTEKTFKIGRAHV